MFDHATDQGRRIGIVFVMMQSKLTSPNIIDPTSNAPEVVVRVRCKTAPFRNSRFLKSKLSACRFSPCL